MVKHIVMWSLTEPEKKSETAAIMKQKLEALVGIVPGLLKLEVGENFTAGAYDVILYSEFESREALALYRDHPAHKECQKYVHSVISGRTAGDMEL